MFLFAFASSQASIDHDCLAKPLEEEPRTLYPARVPKA